MEDIINAKRELDKRAKKLHARTKDLLESRHTISSEEAKAVLREIGTTVIIAATVVGLIGAYKLHAQIMKVVGRLLKWWGRE